MKNRSGKISVCLSIAVVATLFLLVSYQYTFGQETEVLPKTTIEVALGENAVITLESNHTTGFRWELAAPLDRTKLEFVDTNYVTGGSGLMGAGGQEVWTFKTINSGTTEVALKYVQPWEKNKPPAREATVVVVIK